MRKLEQKAFNSVVHYIEILGGGSLRADYYPCPEPKMVIEYFKTKNSRLVVQGRITIIQGKKINVEGSNENFVNYIKKKLK